MGYARDFPERALDLAAVALLEHENRHTRLSELVGRGNEFVVLLLAGVADEDESGHLEQAGFALGVGEETVKVPIDRSELMSTPWLGAHALPQKSFFAKWKTCVVVVVPPATTPRSPFPISIPGV